MIAVPLAELKARAGAMAKLIGPVASIAPASSAIGGGTLPADSLGTFVVSIDTASVEGGADALARRLRIGQPAIMSRIEAERVLLDPRTIPPSRDVEVVKAVLIGLG
jgi:L-seryl-tRNA(Ser) seleniumtransferase